MTGTDEHSTPEARGRSALRWIGLLLALALLAVLVQRLVAGWSELSERGGRVGLVACAWALLIYVTTQILSTANWRWMLSRFGDAPSFRDALRVCGRAWLGRYLPGKLWVVGGKMWLGARLGLSRRVLAVVSLTELALIILVAGTFGSACLLAASVMGVASLPGVPVAFVVAAGFIGIAPPVFRRLLSLGARLTKRPPLASEDVLGVRDLIRAALRVFGIGLFGSAMWVFLLLALLPPDRISTEIVLVALGSGPIGAILGMLAIFAPAGIGVREGTQAALLATVLPVEEAIAIALCARIVNLVGDAVFFGLSVLVGRPGAKREA